jgi:hypothetical protein
MYPIIITKCITANESSEGYSVAPTSQFIAPTKCMGVIHSTI